MQVVIGSPRFNLAPRVLDRQGLVRVQTFIVHLTVKRLDKVVFDRLPGSNVVEQDAASICPIVGRTQGEFGSMIDRGTTGHVVSSISATIM